MIQRVRVFISWSGKNTDSHKYAEKLQEWLPNVIHFIEPFISSENLPAGSRWEQILEKELGKSDFGILCITKENQSAPWLLFEAGILSGAHGSPKRVCPYLIDIEPEDLKPPLNKFNAVKANKDGTFKMIESLNNISDEKYLSDARLKKSFNIWWDEF